MTQEMVSIITPCYNCSKLIGATIESIQQQTYTNWELIIVDDCSTDESVNVVQSYSQNDSRIKLLRTSRPSGSPSEPRNLGIDAARGKYIAFLDSDDVWLPTKLERQITFMVQNGYEMVYSYYEKMSWNGIRSQRIVKTEKKSTYTSLLKSNAIPCLTAVVARGIIGDIRFKTIPQEDFCFWLDILKTGVVAYNYAEVTAIYRESENSRSANKLNMFRGYWNVLRNHQNISIFASCCYMVTYAIYGFLKYIK